MITNFQAMIRERDIGELLMKLRGDSFAGVESLTDQKVVLINTRNLKLITIILEVIR